MKWGRKKWFLSLLICCNLAVYSQNYPAKYLKFEALTINEGLSQGMINCILQDKFGFIWFATKDGLNRYDGYRFVVFKHDPTDSNSVAYNFIQTLFEDSKGRLWIGTAGKGVDLFNRENETFSHFCRDENLAGSPADNHIMQIHEDADNMIWLNTKTGLDRLDVTGGPAKGQPGYTIRRIRDGQFQMFTASGGITYFAGNGKVYFRKKSESGSLLKDTLDLTKFYPFDESVLRKWPVQFYEDSTSSVWLIFGKYISRINRNGIVEKVISQSYGVGAWLSKVFMDESGKLWLGDYNKLFQFNTQTGQSVRILSFSHDDEQFLNNINYIYRDRSGMVWIGTKGYGILKYNPRSEKFNHFGSKSVISLSSPGGSEVLVNQGENSLMIFNIDSAAFTGQIPSPGIIAQPSYSNGLLEGAAQDKEGIYWICKGKVIRYDDKKKSSTEFYCEAETNIPIIVDSKDQVWCGSRNSFCRFDKGLNRFVEYPCAVTASSEPYHFLESFYEDRSGIFWLGTSMGLFRFDPVHHSWKQYKNISSDIPSLSIDFIFSVCPDASNPEKYLWLGTNGGGLCRFEIQTGKMVRYTEKDGLPNNVVYGILTDESNNLWMSTNKGLTRFNPATGVFRNFEMADGLQSNEFNRNAYCKLADGTLFFGGVNGLNYFKPDELKDNLAVPSVQITDIKINNQSLSYKESDSYLRKPAYLTDRITLRYHDKMISFEFASLDFTSPLKNRYQYQLEGFDKQWIQSGTGHSATYTNLNPGTYTFRVKGSNSDDVWNDKGAFIKLEILPPWYMTWWFRTIAVLLVTGGVISWNRFRVNQTKKLMAVRDRIARDLHDEIGSTLQSISLYSAVAGQVVAEKAPEATGMLSQISESTSNMMEAMSDIVWTINTRNDRFDNVVNRMRAFAVEALEARNCKIHFTSDENIGSLNFGMEQRKNLYLIFKESINNAARHSGCRNVWVDFKSADHHLHLKIADDGKGFLTGSNGTGNGLLNLHKRAGELKGTVQIQSEPGKGTVVNLKFRIAKSLSLGI